MKNQNILRWIPSLGKFLKVLNKSLGSLNDFIEVWSFVAKRKSDKN
jgi:hypothetical protein